MKIGEMRSGNWTYARDEEAKDQKQREPGKEKNLRGHESADRKVEMFRIIKKDPKK